MKWPSLSLSALQACDPLKRKPPKLFCPPAPGSSDPARRDGHLRLLRRRALDPAQRTQRAAATLAPWLQLPRAPAAGERRGRGGHHRPGGQGPAALVPGARADARRRLPPRAALGAPRLRAARADARLLPGHAPDRRCGAAAGGGRGAAAVRGGRGARLPVALARGAHAAAQRLRARSARAARGAGRPRAAAGALRAGGARRARRPSNHLTRLLGNA